MCVFVRVHLCVLLLLCNNTPCCVALLSLFTSPVRRALLFRCCAATSHCQHRHPQSHPTSSVCWSPPSSDWPLQQTNGRRKVAQRVWRPALGLGLADRSVVAGQRRNVHVNTMRARSLYELCPTNPRTGDPLGFQQQRWAKNTNTGTHLWRNLGNRPKAL